MNTIWGRGWYQKYHPAALFDTTQAYYMKNIYQKLLVSNSGIEILISFNLKKKFVKSLTKELVWCTKVSEMRENSSKRRTSSNVNRNHAQKIKDLCTPKINSKNTWNQFTFWFLIFHTTITAAAAGESSLSLLLNILQKTIESKKPSTWINEGS